MVEHQNVVNFVLYHARLFGEEVLNRCGQGASVGFDAMVMEVWPCLSTGGALFFAEEQARVSAELLKHWIVEERIRFAFHTTAIAQEMLSGPNGAWGELQVL